LSYILRKPGLECKLELHPEKTRIVYCKDDRRRGSHSHEKFDFLGFTFRSRPSLSKGGRQFVGFNPAVSNKAMKAMRKMNLAKMYNPIIRGWINYYGSYCKTVLYQVFKYLDVVLSRWAKRKYKRIKGRQRRAIHWVKRIIFRQPGLFAHWRFIYAWARR
jgi:RNA-directed DNA polymerase